MLVNYLLKTNRLSEERYNKLKQLLIPIGMLTLVFSIVLSRFFAEYELIDFISGFLIGISMVANIAGIAVLSRNRKKN